MQRRNRNLSLDLYRIICMFLITTIHIVGYSNLVDAIPKNHINYYLIVILQVFQKIAINGFTLISAYFLATAKTTGSKTISFLVQLEFTSVCILLCSAVFLPSNISLSLIVKSLFPVITNHYWYPVNYIFLLLTVPIVNKAISNFQERELLFCIILLIGVTSTFFHINPFFDPSIFIGHESHSLLWFLTLYFIGAYIRLYGVKVSKALTLCVFFTCALIILVCTVVENGDLSAFPELSHILRVIMQRINLTQNNSILVLLMSVSSFVIFENWKIPLRKTGINIFTFLAHTIFGIYLIQEHDAVRWTLRDMINIIQWADSKWLFFIIIAIFVFLWIVSILLYILYKWIYGLFLSRIEAKILEWINRKGIIEKDRPM